MKYPLLIVNFKTYKSGTGRHALLLAKIIQDVREESGANIIACPQPTDLPLVSKHLPTFSQHLDNITYGSHTGWILPEAIKEAGASGTLLNHSEKRLEMIGDHIKRAREVGLYTCLCVENETEAIDMAGLGPDMVALEPPELIGSGISVSRANPDLIKTTTSDIKELYKDIKVLCGAGISSGADVKKALDLGADGALVASAIVCSENPYEILMEIAEVL